MRKLIVLTIAVSVLLIAPTGVASAAPGHDQVNGTGQLGQFGEPTVHVNAIQRPDGISGAFQITYPDGTFVSGPAECAPASVDVVYLTGRITESGGPRQTTNNWQPGNYLVIGVQDKGEPGVKAGDRLNFSAGFATHPGCGPHGAASPDFAIVAGNYRVVDGI